MSDFLSDYELVRNFVRVDGYQPDLVVTDTTLVGLLGDLFGFVQEKGYEYVWVDSGGGIRTITLPSVVGLSKYTAIIVQTAAANSVTIMPDGTDEINGANASIVIAGQWTGFMLQPLDDESGWKAIKQLTI